jgi:hypothetical protein
MAGARATVVSNSVLVVRGRKSRASGAQLSCYTRHRVIDNTFDHYEDLLVNMVVRRMRLLSRPKLGLVSLYMKTLV